MQNISRRQAIALTGAVLAAGAAKPALAADTTQIQTLIDHHAELQKRESNLYDIVEEVEGSPKYKAAKEKTRLVQISRSTNLDIRVLSQSSCHSQTKEIYGALREGMKHILNISETDNVFAALALQESNAIAAIDAAFIEFENDPDIEAYNKASDDHLKAQRATDKAEIAILAFVCHTNEELALKRQWFNEKSCTRYDIEGGDLHAPFLQALVTGYFGKLDNSQS